VTDVESAGCWLSPPEEAPERWRPRSSDDEMIRIATALGARGLVATHFGAPAPAEEAAGAFAQLCNRAAAVGVHVSLEFPAMATINDVATAWEIVRLAGRPNGSILVDVWHHRRSTNDDMALSAIPGEKITGLQLADGTAQPVGPSKTTSSCGNSRAMATLASSICSATSLRPVSPPPSVSKSGARSCCAKVPP
jgi:sugar phosphate isomerase/epimerase